MSVLTVTQQAALVLGIERPEILFADTSRTALELQDAVNMAAQQIVDDFDWQALTKTATLAGDDVTTALPLPTDYRRMMRTAEVWTDTGPSRVVEPLSPEEYLAVELDTFSGWAAYWAVFGNALNVQPARATGENVRFMYISKNWAQSGSVVKASFTLDDDTFLLDERLLRQCLVYRWKQAKGFDYAADLNDYEQTLSYLTAQDKGTQIIRRSNYGGTFNVRPALPWGL